MEPNARNQTLTCSDCGSSFLRRIPNGRPAKRCDNCRKINESNRNKISRGKRGDQKARNIARWNTQEARQNTTYAETRPVDSDKPKHPGGRPTSYRKEYVGIAKRYYRKGATDAEVAELLGVGIWAIMGWAHKYPEFDQARKAGKNVTNKRVERSLYNRAVGYTYEAEKVFFPAGAPGPVKVTYREHVPPDVAACMNWLKNRDPERWREKFEAQTRHDHYHHGGDPRYRDTPDHELEKLIRAEARQAPAPDDDKPTTH